MSKYEAMSQFQFDSTVRSVAKEAEKLTDEELRWRINRAKETAEDPEGRLGDMPSGYDDDDDWSLIRIADIKKAWTLRAETLQAELDRRLSLPYA